MPSQLVDAVEKGDLVVFAGGGISTEDRVVMPTTFYERIADEIHRNKSNSLDFPGLMSKFCEQPNGRQKLLTRITERFSYIESFPELYNGATEFHRQLSTIFQIENIITTNWDAFFERECGATPYVSPEDFALWELPGRKVFKIHGSVNNVGSIVATTDDYTNCYERLETGLMGSVLKTLLATKTVVYIGYSFQDTDFVKIHELLTSEMKGMRPHSYLITLDDSTKARFEKTGITPIVTAGKHFLVRLKEHLVAEEQMLPDTVFKGVFEAYERVIAAHRFVSSVDLRKYPTAILTLTYQDGLMHALSRILARRRTGEYSNAHNIHHRLEGYETFRSQEVRKKAYEEIAYVDGYLNGVFFLVADSAARRGLPVYYVFGRKDQPSTKDDYRKLLKKAESTHRSAYRYCRHAVQNTDLRVSGVVVHHPPFL
jgi:SIR2-like protein